MEVHVSQSHNSERLVFNANSIPKITQPKKIVKPDIKD